MKTVIGMLFVCLLAVSPAVAQDGEFVAPALPQDELVPIAPDTRPTIDGVVAAIFANPVNAVQLVNPLAPAEYGNGEAFISRDPEEPEIPKGIIIFGIEF